MLKDSEILRPGQKVLITRTATVTYEIDIADWLDDDDDKEISVQQLKECETNSVSIDELSSTYDTYDIEDDEITSVEVI
jgi:hypothetical protein